MRFRLIFKVLGEVECNILRYHPYRDNYGSVCIRITLIFECMSEV